MKHVRINVFLLYKFLFLGGPYSNNSYFVFGRLLLSH